MPASSHRPVHLAPPTLEVARRPDGSFLLSTAEALQAAPPHPGHWLRQWAETAPERTFLGERAAGGGWRQLGYGEAQRTADRLSQALLDRGLGPARPLMILSGNSIAHALLSLAAGSSDPKAACRRPGPGMAPWIY